MNGCIYRTEDNKCEFWSDHGKGIVSYCDFDDCEEKKPSNADHIRAMTDEEIADFLCDIGECDRRCPAKIGDCIFSDSTCRSAWLDWLKEEGE